MRGRVFGARFAIALGLATLAALAWSAAAGAYVYWADTASGTIGRATNDGSHVEPDFIAGLGQPKGVAVDSTHIYWADQKERKIGRANLDGSGVAPKFISTVGRPDSIAVNGSYIVWGSEEESTIGRATAEGASPNSEFLKPEEKVCGVGVDSGHIYWVSPTGVTDSYVGRAPLGGGMPVEKEFTTILGSPFACGMAVSTADIFWSDLEVGSGTRIGRADTLTGGGSDPSFVAGANGPCGVAVLGSQVYWANLNDGTIGRANTDSSGLQPALFHTGGSEICGIAVDALAPPAEPPAGGGGSADTTPPQTKIKRGPGKKLSGGGAKFAFASSESGSTFSCQLDKRKAGACRSPKSYAGLKPGRHTFSVSATDAAGSKDPTPAVRSFRVPPR